MICEICGRRKATRKIYIEGALVEVCDSCGKEDTPKIDSTRLKRPKEQIYKIYRPVSNIKEIITNFLKTNNLSIEQLANIIHVSKQDLKAIMEGRSADREIIKKLEKYIKATLIQEVVIRENIEEEKREKETVKLEEFINGK